MEGSNTSFNTACTDKELEQIGPCRNQRLVELNRDLYLGLNSWKFILAEGSKYNIVNLLISCDWEGREQSLQETAEQGKRATT